MKWLQFAFSTSDTLHNKLSVKVKNLMKPKPEQTLCDRNYAWLFHLDSCESEAEMSDRISIFLPNRQLNVGFSLL
ncbi:MULTISPECIES: hypothetical protein [Cyanophyceae]|uniref:hypothetical protein n=1 Tax=Cyanophyceae TaxID=3028117 RepID=UPI001688E085|nr:hypothetical protein [Trichocoleus sp. FACHB-40]MBD2005213.1 hypothetical protein [Trichocoleus sp. FACHB-40]